MGYHNKLVLFTYWYLNWEQFHTQKLWKFALEIAKKLKENGVIFELPFFNCTVSLTKSPKDGNIWNMKLQILL
jgi:hypothetical protein